MINGPCVFCCVFGFIILFRFGWIYFHFPNFPLSPPSGPRWFIYTRSVNSSTPTNQIYQIQLVDFRLSFYWHLFILTLTPRSITIVFYILSFSANPKGKYFCFVLLFSFSTHVLFCRFAWFTNSLALFLFYI